MKSYFVNIQQQSNGDHEVHTAYCTYFPLPKNLKFLGEFDTCKQAVTESRKLFSQSNGCKTCCESCHTS